MMSDHAQRNQKCKEKIYVSCALPVIVSESPIPALHIACDKGGCISIQSYTEGTLVPKGVRMNLVWWVRLRRELWGCGRGFFVLLCNRWGRGCGVGGIRLGGLGVGWNTSGAVFACAGGAQERPCFPCYCGFLFGVLRKLLDAGTTYDSFCHFYILLISFSFTLTLSLNDSS